MAKIKRVLRCHRCGVVLQGKKKSEPGYINPELIASETAQESLLYCNNCYEKLKAMNGSVLSAESDEQILKILDDAKATDALIIWVIDTFLFNGTISPEIVKKVKHLDVVVIGTKIDLFDKRVKREDISNFIRDRFEEVGIKPYSIHLFGKLSNLNGDELLAKLEKARAGHDVYMIGSIASGKTTIINKLLGSFKNKSKWQIKSETYGGTNAKILEIPLSNSAFFYEVPGFSLVNSVLGKVEKDVSRLIIPKNKVITQTKNLNAGESIMIGSLGAFSLVKGKTTAFKFYSGELVEIKKHSNKHLQMHMAENCEKKTYRPVSERYNSFQDFDLFEYTMENDGLMHDISISGLGWVSFIAKGQIVHVLLPKGVAVKESLSKIK